MTDPAVRRSWARETGFTYLLYFLTAILGQILVGKGIVVPGKVTNCISVALYIILGLMLYRLFEPVGKTLSLVAALFNFAGSTTMLMALFRSAKTPINPLLFFGIYCLLIGVLILRSAFLPRVLGLLIAAAGVGWLVFLTPLHSRMLAVSLEVLGFISEAALMMWLLVKGVEEQKWLATIARNA